MRIVTVDRTGKPTPEPAPTRPPRAVPSHTLDLTTLEWSALSEAVRFLQDESWEATGQLVPTLSRIQRKMGEEPHHD
jgi:hypothetical protein